MSYEAVMAAHKAQVLSLLNAAREDLTGKQMLRHMPANVGVERMQYLLRLLVADKAIHIVRTHGKTRFYRVGTETGLTAPTPAERILFVLAELGPQTSRQLSASTGISKTHLCQIINRDLRPADGQKQVYIRQYLKQGNARPLLYAIGNRPDAIRPRPLTSKEKNRRRAIRLRADADKIAEARMRDRLRKIKPKADPVMSQFAGIFGRPAA